MNQKQLKVKLKKPMWNKASLGYAQVYGANYVQSLIKDGVKPSKMLDGSLIPKEIRARLCDYAHQFVKKFS